MEQQAQTDLFSQKRFELMIEMATKKLQQEITLLKDQIVSLNSEIGSVKNQITRIQFQPQQSKPVQRTLEEPQSEKIEIQQKKEVKIVDCRPDNEKKDSFQSGSARNAEPIKPRYGDYDSKDVSIDKFFYFGRK